MEPIFAVKSVYSEEMFYHQTAASVQKKPVEKKGKSRMPKFNIGLKDALFLGFFMIAYYAAFPEREPTERIVMAVFSGGLTWVIYGFITRRGKKKEAEEGDGKGKTSDSEADLQLRQKARALLENSCLSGVSYTVQFFDDGFQVENPMITTWYRYEGIAWIKETSKYFIIFWNQAMAIPVEKAGLYRGKSWQLKDFLESKCDKTIETVRRQDQNA